MRRILATAVLCALALAFGPAPAAAQGFRQVAFTSFTADVTLTTTTEKDVVTSDPVPLTTDNSTVCVIGWAQLTTGSSTTAVTPMIRRGAGITGTALTESNAENVKAAAGSTEPFFAMACESRSSTESASYSFTLKQTGAAANGTALAGGILVLAK